MKITFFIGNGYDINIGLKTAYPDFLKWYVQRLLTCENTYLLIVNYDKNYNKVLPYTTSLIAMKIIANLLEVSECPLEHQDRVKGKIAVLLNTELFKYSSLVERQGSAALIK